MADRADELRDTAAQCLTLAQSTTEPQTRVALPFHGLTSGERKRLTEIRFLAQVDLATAKIVAADWVLSNNQRRVLRQAACRTVKLLDLL
jgi:hypothetical protein